MKLTLKVDGITRTIEDREIDGGYGGVNNLNAVLRHFETLLQAEFPSSMRSKSVILRDDNNIPPSTITSTRRFNGNYGRQAEQNIPNSPLYHVPLDSDENAGTAEPTTSVDPEVSFNPTDRS